MRIKRNFQFDPVKYGKIIADKKMASRMIKQANDLAEIKADIKLHNEFINYSMPEVTDPEGRYEC